MSKVSAIRVIFVLPENVENEESASSNMWQSYNACKTNGLIVSWRKQCKENLEETKKTDVVVFEQFAGEFFNQVIASKSTRVLAPHCLFHCLKESISIPQIATKTALRSVALLSCCVVVSNFPRDIKIELKRKIQSMSGLYCQDLVTDATHLITNSVKSEKYIAAVERGMCVMLSSFIDVLWTESETRAINASNAEFAKHKCPIFYNLTICSTGFTKTESKIPQIVHENGGKFCYKMIPKETDVLVCKTTASEKYKFALKSKVTCVTDSWIFDSVAKGFALPNHADYTVKGKTSTPTKLDQTDPNFSMMSEIGRVATQSLREVDETLQDSFINAMSESRHPDLPAMKGKKRISDEWLNQLDIKRAKMAGPFLDGCVIYLAGFSVDELERLVKIINYSGAIRSDSLNKRVTHAIFNDVQHKDIKQLAQNVDLTCFAVTTKWLIDSMNAKTAVDVDSYLITSSNESIISALEGDSPLIRKGLTLLRSESNEKDKHNDIDVVEKNDDQAEIMKRYLSPVTTLGQSDMDAALAAFSINQNNSEKTIQNNDKKPSNEIPNNEKGQTSSMTLISTLDETKEETKHIFANLKFAVVNFTPGDEEDEIISNIEHLKGIVVSKHFKGVPDYAVIPIGSQKLQITAACVVTFAWLSDCIEQGRLITDLEYYHVPFSTTKANILVDQVIALSGFTRIEKVFWKHAIEEMGGTHQDCMARITNLQKETIKTTHLIAAEASGKKYIGAVKWGIPVVEKEWLLECNKQGCLVDSFNYLIGESKDYFANLREENEIQSPTDSSTSCLQPSSTANKANIEQNHQKYEIAREKLECVGKTSKLKENFAPVNSPTRDEALVGSQMTPVSEIIARVRGLQTKDMKTPPINSRTIDPLSSKTPALRAQFANWLQDFPTPRKSTPLHEVKQRFWENYHCSTPPYPTFPRQLNFPDEENVTEKEKEVVRESETTENQSTQDIAMEKLLIDQIGQLEQEIKSSTSTPMRKSSMKRAPAEGCAIPAKESQPLFVGWNENMDITSPRCSTLKADNGKTSQPRMFMISGVDADTRTTYIQQLGKLGASVSALANFDSSATHLLCEKLNRNEKLLASLASGLWIVHVSYLEASIKAGKLLNEEDYEFGNPDAKFVVNLNNDELLRAAACYYWRKEVKKRGYGAFHDVRAIIVAERKEPMVRVLSAGGAVIVDAKPPFNGNITATHCFLEAKNPNLKEYIPLAEQGILCLNTLYVNGFLNRTIKHVSDFYIPSFHKYY